MEGQEKTLGTKPNNPSFISWTHPVGGRNNSPMFSSDQYTHTVSHRQTHADPQCAHIHKQIDVQSQIYELSKKKVKTF